MFRAFLHYSGEAVMFGIYPYWKVEFRWKDACDGRTWIRPYVHASGYPEHRR